ncbi:MAG: DNA-binding protein [Comamonas sp.]|jgi:chromosome segregation ATPase|nr:DNA-binding protein [Comamonas sp.]
MGRESVITQEEVNSVADQLRATGAKPTARAVREALGGGSMATVLKHLHVWQSHQVRAPDTQAVLPVGLQRALVDFIAQEVASAKVTLEADLVTAQQANQDLIAESERLAAALEREQSAVKTLQADKAELSGRLGQLTKDLEEVRAEAVAQREAAEHARTEKAKLELRLEGVPRLEAEIERLKVALESERSAKVVAEQQAAVAQARLEKTEGQLKELVVNNPVPRLDAELVKLKASLDEERAVRVSAEQQAAVAQAKLEKTEAQATDLAARLAKVEAWLEEDRAKAPSKS